MGQCLAECVVSGMLLFCIATVRKRRPGNGSANAAANDDFRFRSICLYTYTGLIAVLGGFLFHTIWEANSRYIFVYSLLLMPYCAAGIHEWTGASGSMAQQQNADTSLKFIKAKNSRESNKITFHSVHGSSRLYFKPQNSQIKYKNMFFQA